jgi:hypothetical protein
MPRRALAQAKALKLLYGELMRGERGVYTSTFSRAARIGRHSRRRSGSGIVCVTSNCGAVDQRPPPFSTYPGRRS